MRTFFLVPTRRVVTEGGRASVPIRDVAAIWTALENHLHLIAQSPDLPVEIGSFKSWSAKRLLDVLQEQRAERILKQLAFYKKAHKTGPCYQDWEEGSHPEQIQDPAMMPQKIEYIHQNPVKRGYFDNPVYWRNCSARSYTGKTGC